MELYVGTSGFAYKEWKGEFYPKGLADREMLAYYARQFNAVEINSTFYRFPTAGLLSNWSSQVPKGFRFAIKVPRRITHIKRLQNVDEDVDYLMETVASLGPHLGPLLFQCPPRMPLDLDSLGVLVNQLPAERRSAFEFRHPSWFCEDVYQLLEGGNHALCFNDDTMPAPRRTANWEYLRLRRSDYSDVDLTETAQYMSTQEVYAFFKHHSASAPQWAHRWRDLAASATNRTP